MAENDEKKFYMTNDVMLEFRDYLVILNEYIKTLPIKINQPKQSMLNL